MAAVYPAGPDPMMTQFSTSSTPSASPALDALALALVLVLVLVPPRPPPRVVAHRRCLHPPRASLSSHTTAALPVVVAIIVVITSPRAHPLATRCRVERGARTIEEIEIEIEIEIGFDGVERGGVWSEAFHVRTVHTCKL